MEHSVPGGRSTGNPAREDHIEAYLPGDRRRALAAGVAIRDRTVGAAVFCDISGFTPLTEALVAELGAQRGAEELTGVLATVFDAVLGELHRHGGSVLYFSGDAVTCWIEGDDGESAVSCALAMRDAMSRVSEVRTPGGSEIRLGMKLAVAAGPARRFVVGDPRIQRIDVLAGALMDRLAEAEHHAERGEAVLDAATAAALAGRVEIEAWRGGGQFAVVSEVLVPPAPAPPPENPPLRTEIVREWLLPAVYARLEAGLGDFLAELRPGVPMFVRFGGIDYDADPDALDALDTFVTSAQRVVDGFGGNVVQLTIGDKGAYLYAVFGAPQAHEDDCARACAAALELVALEAGSRVRGLQVGIASGRVWSGSYGHWYRRTFTCLGDVVNLAARLMSAAPPGQVYVSEEVALDCGDGFDFEDVGELSLKGKARPVATRRLVGRGTASARRRRRAASALLGRSAELERLVSLAERALSGAGQIVAIRAEAGMGKSRLVEELLERLSGAGPSVHVGAAVAVGASSYLAWRPIVAGMLGAGEDGVEASAAASLAAVDPRLVVRLPLLAAVLGVPIEDNELTASFDAKLRKSSLESLIARYVSLRAASTPLVLVLEDCHWLDPLSCELLEVLARGVGGLSVLVVLTLRPGSFSPPATAVTSVIELDRLDPESSQELLRQRLHELYGRGAPVSRRLLQRLDGRAEGNPFYLEELVNFLRSQVAELDEAAAGSLELPSSLASLVLSRIDTLGGPPRRTLKVASVIGREFGVPVLSGSYPALGDGPTVARHLHELWQQSLVLPEDAETERYAFRHAVIRDVAYDSLPYALRGELHTRVARFIEASDPQAFDVLAHHFVHGTDPERARHYLRLAADAAQARFANEAAVDYLRRLLPLIEEGERPAVLMRLGAVLELSGDWSGAESTFGEALAQAQGRGDAAAAGRARAARADPVRKQGRYEEALAELERAEQVLAGAGDDAGLGRVAHLRGTIAAQRGHYDEARSEYERSLEIRRRLGEGAAEASLLSNLAILAEYEGDYARARQLNEQALALRTLLGDRWGIGVSQNNLGMICHLLGNDVAAREHLEESLRIELEVGDSWMVAVARQNLGNATRELGEPAAARRHYAEALATYAGAGDRWAQCLLFEDVVALVIESEPAAALRLAGAAEAIRREIGAPRVAAQQAALDERLQHARERLGADASREHAIGLALGDLGARELAAALLDPARSDPARSDPARSGPKR